MLLTVALLAVLAAAVDDSAPTLFQEGLAGGVEHPAALADPLLEGVEAPSFRTLCFEASFAADCCILHESLSVLHSSD